MFDIIITVAPVIITTIGGIIAIKKFKGIKNKLSLMRILIDDVDDALYDDKISELEFRKIFQSVRAVIKE